jgi:N-formylmaleamate deformylase
MEKQWSENNIIVNGASFHYVRTGGARPPLVLAHGFSDNGLCWLPLARDLEGVYDVIMPDARGHGLSQRVLPGETIDGARDLASLIRALGLERPIIGGHSMGANTASTLAAQNPGLVRALVLEDPGWRDLPPEPQKKDEAPKPNPWVDWLMSLPNLTLEQVMDKCRSDSPTWPEVELRPWAESKKALDLNVFKAEPARMPWREVVRAIDCPTLLITGDPQKGSIITPEMARAAQALNGQIQVVHIPGVGHNIRRENYPAYRHTVRSFLQTIK